MALGALFPFALILAQYDRHWSRNANIVRRRSVECYCLVEHSNEKASTTRSSRDDTDFCGCRHRTLSNAVLIS
ncbi:hypothetical protein JAAARDRAFT_30392 [Jaapia argillacea MUCL 33604]|uniref:Uncharacterized protein n=1 Tax=Jaapia argillacea MUCL 33604 TaxID=933084 RepID=A0A067Q6B5_9AGAM|nr:hypothetical protein JAAARDRAFT_30392 [Jaapia argillacea MUCL 33604]